MNEKLVSYSSGQAQPDRYIRRISATMVTLVRLLEGVAIGVGLFYLLRFLIPFSARLAQGAVDLNQFQEMILPEGSVTGAVLSEYMGSSFGKLTPPLIVWGILAFIDIALPLLVLMETIAILLLRTVKRGAGLIRAAHMIYLGLNIAGFPLFVFSVYQMFRYSSGLKDADSRVTGYVLSVVFVIVFLIQWILQLCYHKDVAMAMDTVRYEVRTGFQGTLRKTHLSGISFLFSLPYLALLGAVVARSISSFVNGRTPSPADYHMTMTEFIAAIIFLSLMMIKHLSVCFCNRNLKKAR